MKTLSFYLSVACTALIMAIPTYASQKQYQDSAEPKKVRFNKNINWGEDGDFENTPFSLIPANDCIYGLLTEEGWFHIEMPALNDTEEIVITIYKDEETVMRKLCYYNGAIDLDIGSEGRGRYTICIFIPSDDVEYTAEFIY